MKAGDDANPGGHRGPPLQPRARFALDRRPIPYDIVVDLLFSLFECLR